MKAGSETRSRLATLAQVLTLLLVANSAYIAAFGDPNLFYVLNAILHPFLGIVVAILFGILVGRRRELFAVCGGALTIALLGLATGFGVYLAVGGMTRPHSRALYAHVSLAMAGFFVLLVRSRPRVVDRSAPREPRKLPYQRAWHWSAGVIIASAAFYGTIATYHHFFPIPQYIIRNPLTPPLSMDREGGGRDSFMFPSSAQTSDGKLIRSEFFMNSESCEKCHADIYNQWFSSMHHFASFNNQWYRKSIEYMQDTIGVKPSLWCAGCHDHALAFSGIMQKQPIRNIVDTPQARAGLGCMSCHAIVQVEDSMGQGGFVIEYPALDRLASSKNLLLRAVHDYAVKLNPKPHRHVFLKPFHKQPEHIAQFCSVCHKVHLDVPVNNYRWIRGFDDYDNWQASGVSGLGARSFYYPPKPQQCADCHMPLVPSKDFGNVNGFVHSHRFAAANTAVPITYGDKEQIREVEKFLKGALSVDIFALAEEPKGEEEHGRPAGRGLEAPQLASTFASGEESSAGMASPAAGLGRPAALMAPLGRSPARLRRGDTVRVEVVVRTRRLGHFFPAGTVDAFDCWLELRARDGSGRMIFWSGEASDNGRGPVEPGAHFYRSLQLDGHGNVINKRNAWSTRAVMYAHLIPPGAADTAHFRLKVPPDCVDPITLTAKLNYRKFSWWNTNWAFGGIRNPSHPHPDVTKDYDDGPWVFQGDLSEVSAKFKQIPDVPTVVIGENSVTLAVAAKESRPFAETVKLDPKDRERWNDYGIGLLLQGDLKGAERAFEKVTELDPTYADGWVNVGRARIQEGNTEAAKPVLLKALALNPNLASAHFFYGLAIKADGKYAEAYDQFALAAARYPYDRVNRNQMGRMLFLQRKYREAVAEYQRTLTVDPEDLEAHYNLMLCYRGLGNEGLAALEEQLDLRFKADEASRAITGPYKLRHLEDNNEAQPIHEHYSAPLEKAGKGLRPYTERAATSTLPYPTPRAAGGRHSHYADVAARFERRSHPGGSGNLASPQPEFPRGGVASK